MFSVAAKFNKYHMMRFGVVGIVGFFDANHYWPRHLKVTVDGVPYHIISQETLGL